MDIPSSDCGPGGFFARGRILVPVLCLWLLSGSLAPALSAQERAEPTKPAPDAQEQVADDAPETFDQWMQKARQGDPKAQCNVGIFYINGESVPLNVRQGVEWLRRSAEQGFSYAQYVLAELYTSGDSDLAADTPEAYFWASISAAATDLPDKIQRKARKLRDLNQDRLPPEQMKAVQEKTAEWWEAYGVKP